MGKKNLQFIIKYENNKMNKAILALLWDLNARNHEITLLRIKNIRLEKYDEDELPYESKTGNGPIMLTLSFPYVRDWLNEHPFSNEVNARIICNIENGKPLLGVVSVCSKVGVIDLPTLTPTMMNCSSSYWCIMT